MIKKNIDEVYYVLVNTTKLQNNFIATHEGRLGLICSQFKEVSSAVYQKLAFEGHTLFKAALTKHASKRGRIGCHWLLMFVWWGNDQ